MEIFLERLLLELAAIALQLAIMRIVAWLRSLAESRGAPVGLAVAA